jgi:putative transcriptional regulator
MTNTTTNATKPNAKTNAKSSSILEAVHETMGDFHAIGLADKRTMRQFDALCVRPIEPFDSTQIKALREKYHISQAVLAGLFNTSLSTVRQWEIGLKRPSGAALKLLNLLSNKGIEGLV